MSWREAFAVYSHPRVIAMLFLGFSAGLPLLLVFSTLTAWLTDEGLSRTAIGFFAWVGITYSIKVIWAPVVDHVSLPVLGRLGQRRSWILLAQLGIALGLIAMSQLQPANQLLILALLSVFVAFCSATQDIAIDAYRIEAVDTNKQGAMSATYILGYRLAMLMAGAGAFYIAEFESWNLSYLTMGLLLAMGMATTLLIREPIERKKRHYENMLQWIEMSVAAPFKEFFQRYGRLALTILCLVGFYRLSDITMGIMANPFYLDMGYSKLDIANIGKIFGFVMTILGAGAGGVLVVRYGVYGPLLLGAVLVASTNLLFVLLSTLEPSLPWLAFVISADNLSGGLAGAAFIAYLSSMTSAKHTATQYALFSSLMTLPAKFLSGFSGVVVDAQGYAVFFSLAALFGIPAILLTMRLKSNIKS
ncbi:MAG: AmpG family muropeptide MFS transporter [Pseudomonadota bacterium]